MTKNKSLIDAVRVGTPCSEDWNSMKGNDQVRFCSHCAKDVNDLSSITRKEAAKLVAASGRDICIRYVMHPVTKRPIFADQLLQITRRAPSISAGVVAASISLANSAYAQSVPPKSVPEPVAAAVQLKDRSEIVDQAPSAGSISGSVKDPNGAVLPGASLKLTSKLGTVERQSNDEGWYSFDGLEPGNYRLEIGAPNFLSQVHDISVEAQEIDLADTTLAPGGFELVVEVKMDLQMELATTVSGGAIAIIEYSSPLSSAIASGDIEQARELIVKGAKVNAREDSFSKITPLFIAVETGNVEMVRLLLDSGASASARDEDKQNVLMRLDLDATAELADLLIAYGAKVGQKDKEGNTPLMLASRSASGAVVQRLIDHGADMDAANKEGETALMIAADYNNIGAVRALLLAGADPDRKDNEGETAIDNSSDETINALIKSRGIEPPAEPAIDAVPTQDDIEEPAAPDEPDASSLSDAGPEPTAVLAEPAP